MALAPEVILNGTCSLIFITLSIFLSLVIISKYVKHKDKNLLYAGLAWIGISEPWWGSSLGFLVGLTNDVGISVEMYVLVAYCFIPIFLIPWLALVGNLTNMKKTKLVIVIYVLIALILEVLIFYYMVSEVSVLALYINPVDIDNETIIVIYLLLNLVLFLICGFLIVHESLRSGNKEIELKGKFICIALILFLIGAMWDIIQTSPIGRLILATSAIFFYIGFILPEWVKKKFLS